MYETKLLSRRFIESFNYKSSKQNVDCYFNNLEIAEFRYAKLNCLRGLTAKYDLTESYQKHQYSPIGKDMFNISAKECSEEVLKQFIYSYQHVLDSLEEIEQKYIVGHYRKRKSDDELITELELNHPYIDSYEFRHIKRSAIIKFAYFLDIEVEKDKENKD